MRGFYKVLFSSVIIMLMPVSLLAQGAGFNSSYLEFGNIGGGARAAGMGGAYLGVADGEMAYSWNPASMLRVDKTKFGIQLASIGDKFNTVAVDMSSYYPQPNIQELEIKRSHFSLNYGGLAIPFEFADREWAVGGGYRNVFDLISEYSYPGFNNTRNTYTQDRGMDAASGAIAVSVIPEISVGMNINAYLRNSEYNYYEGATFQYVAQNGIDTSLVDVWINDNSHFSGFNVDLGISADYGMVKGGFVFHSPYNLTQNMRQTFSIIIPPQPVGAIDRIKFKYNMPAAYSAGIAVVPMENLTVAVDLSLMKLSNVDVSIDYQQIIYNDTTYSAEWEDITQYRFGAEYMYDAGFAEIPIRAGFRNEPSTAKELTNLVNGTPTYGDQISTNIISFGSGLHFDNIWFDIAYQFGSSSYSRTVDYGTSETFDVKRDYSRLVISSGMYFYTP